MIYSHIYDLLGKLISVLVAVVIFSKTGILDFSKKLSLHTSNPQFYDYIFFVILLFVLYVLIYRPFVSVITTYLYVRTKFGVSPTWEESKKLRKLFSLGKENKWLPMNDVKKIHKGERLDALLKVAKLQ